MLDIPVLGRQRQEAPKLKANVVYRARPCLKKKKTYKKKTTRINYFGGLFCNTARDLEIC
jgi:hypothetical protein